MGGVFYNCQFTIPTQHIFEVLSHRKLLTPVKIDNYTTHGFAHDNMHQIFLNPEICDITSLEIESQGK